MIRCVRLWTGEDNNSHFEEGSIELEPGQRGDALSNKIDAVTISFQETGSGGAFSWHTAPVRQLVITLSGTLDFQTRDASTSCFIPATSCWRKTPQARGTAGS